MKIKYFLLIIFLFKFIIAFPQTQGVVLTILDDSVVVQVNNKTTRRGKETINITISIENNTDSTIIFYKQRDIYEGYPQELHNFRESFDRWAYFRKFLFDQDNEPM